MTTIEHIVAPEELMAYLDGELAPERTASVRAHLSDCSECQALAAELRDVTDGLREWQVEAPPDTLQPPAVAPDARRSAAVRWLRWPPAARHAAAAALVIVTLGSFVWVLQSPKGRYSLTRRPAEAMATVSLGGEPGTLESARVNTPGRGRAGGSVAPLDTENRRMIGGLPPQVAHAQAGQPRVETRGPQIVRTVNLSIVTKDFAAVRPAVDGMLRQLGGFVGSIQVSGDSTSGSMHATLRVPADRLDAAVAALRGLGHVVEERQTGDDVTEQVRDLEARLTNSRNTEKRLTEVLRTRTGPVSDVLEVEREIARVREEIERMDAERTNLERRVAYATITLQVGQERQATLNLGPLPVSTKLRNATVDGLRDAFEGAIAVVLWVLTVGPTLLLWVLVLWWPARVLIRRGRVWSANAG